LATLTRSEAKHLTPVHYFLVWAALLVLTGLTVAVWKVDLSFGARIVAAISIATVKAVLVAVFFMHLWEERGVARLVLVVATAFVALLIGLTLMDNATRFPFANPPYSESWAGEPYQKAAPPLQAEPPPVRTSPGSDLEHPAAHKP
jgi:cytochrome c oxidase subunit 4